MNWKDVAATVVSNAPLLGTLLGGPAGGAIGTILSSALGVNNTPDEVSQALATQPDAVVKLKQIEATRQTELQSLLVQAEANRIAADTQVVLAVNKTMQAETVSDHWPTYSWRPFIGFVVGGMAFGCYFVLPLLQVPVPAVPESVWLMFGGILGVASWFRGKAQADPQNPMPVKG